MGDHDEVRELLVAHLRDLREMFVLVNNANPRLHTADVMRSAARAICDLSEQITRRDELELERMRAAKNKVSLDSWFNSVCGLTTPSAVREWLGLPVDGPGQDFSSGPESGRD